MSLPAPEWSRRKSLANVVASAERSCSQTSMPSSSTLNATSGAMASGCRAAQAAFRAFMIGASSIRVRAFGSCGDCPCFADSTITVLEGADAGVDVVQRLAEHRSRLLPSVLVAARQLGGPGGGGDRGR